MSAPQRGANYDNFRGTNFAREADNEIEQESGYEKGHGRNDEEADEMEHDSNDLRANLGATSKDVAPLIPSLAKPKPRLHLNLHLPDLPVLNTRPANRYEEIMEPSTPRSRLANQFSPLKPPQGYRSAPLDFGVPPPNTRQLEESDQDDFAAVD